MGKFEADIASCSFLNTFTYAICNYSFIWAYGENEELMVIDCLVREIQFPKQELKRVYCCYTAG